MASSTPSQAPTIVAVAPRASKPKPDGERKYRGKDQTQDTLNYLLQALLNYNNAPGRLHDDKWEINFSILRRWVKSKPALDAFLLEHQAEIEAHHHQHGIEEKHNYRHRGKLDIQALIHLPDHLKST